MTDVGYAAAMNNRKNHTTIFSRIFPLGIGTNRLPVNGTAVQEGLERSAGIIAAALDAGASYIDVSHTYSRGFAQAACKLAFEQSRAPRHITVKSSFKEDKSMDDALYRVDNTFSNLNIDHASYFVLWNIENLAMFEKIMKKGSLYDGALKAKAAGLIDHICFSSHAPADELITMLESGAFEGVTAAYSPLNSVIMKPVLDCALKHDIGVAVMNPLGGGVIPQNEEYFSFLRHPSDRSAAQAALRFAYAHPAVDIVLSGLHSMEELEENLPAFTEPQNEPAEDRIVRVEAGFCNLEEYCTGCRYCEGCPAEIPICELMQSRNAALFTPASAYGRTDPELLRDIQMFRKLYLDFQIIPHCGANPCIFCGRCENKCTQRLKIMQAVSEVYASAEKRGFTLESRKQKLDGLLNGKNYRRVAFYPGAGYSRAVLDMSRDFFGAPPFEVLFFDSSPALWGSCSGGIGVHSPDEIAQLKPDIILVSNYNYLDEIYESLRHYENDGIAVKKLHDADEVPWVF